MTKLQRNRRLIIFFFNDTATTEIYTLSLHDALPILLAIANALEGLSRAEAARLAGMGRQALRDAVIRYNAEGPSGDRKSTRLNSSHANISYAVFCLKKKK